MRERAGPARSMTRSPALRAPACDAAGRRQLHHQASKGRARDRRMASRDASLDPGRGIRWPDNARPDRRHEGVKPAHRARVQLRSQRDALGKAEAEAGSMRRRGLTLGFRAPFLRLRTRNGSGPPRPRTKHSDNVFCVGHRRPRIICEQVEQFVIVALIATDCCVS